MDQAGDKLIDMIVRTANGRMTAAEALGHKEFVMTSCIAAHREWRSHQLNFRQPHESPDAESIGKFRRMFETATLPAFGFHGHLRQYVRLKYLFMAEFSPNFGTAKDSEYDDQL